MLRRDFLHNKLSPYSITAAITQDESLSCHLCGQQVCLCLRKCVCAYDGVIENETIIRPTQTQLFYCCAAQMCFHRQTACVRVHDHIEERVTPPPVQLLLFK